MLFFHREQLDKFYMLLKSGTSRSRLGPYVSYFWKLSNINHALLTSRLRPICCRYYNSRFKTPLQGSLSTYLLTDSFLRTFILWANLVYWLRKCGYTLASGGSRPLIYLFTKNISLSEWVKTSVQTKAQVVTMIYSLSMEANRTARLSSQPPSRFSEHKKAWEKKDGWLKERGRKIVETYAGLILLR